jgi:hypothetical protein
VRLTAVKLQADGWDYEGYVDNVRLYDTLPGYDETLPFYFADYGAYDLNITSPQDGVVYSPCAPDVIEWNTDVPSRTGDWNRILVEWRRMGGPWHSLGLNDVGAPCTWSAPPCDAGLYQVRAQHKGAPALADTVTFAVQPPPSEDPDICLFVDFAGDAQYTSEVQSRIDPVPYTSVIAYIGASRIDGEPEGITVVSLRLNDMISGCPGVVATQAFMNLLPGGLTIGNPFGTPGVTIASTECFTVPYSEVTYIGRVEFFYLGGACDLQILDHWQYPRWVVDCGEPGNVTTYCVWSNGGIGKDPVGGDASCQPNTAVEATSWGAIKAMYR